jgi:hypothetical protein
MTLTDICSLFSQHGIDLAVHLYSFTQTYLLDHLLLIVYIYEHVQNIVLHRTHTALFIERGLKDMVRKRNLLDH